MRSLNAIRGEPLDQNRQPANHHLTPPGELWPVIAEYRPAGFQLASRKEGELHLRQDWQAELLARDLDRQAYGRSLGQALFQNQIRDAFMYAHGQAAEHLRLLLVVEDTGLTSSLPPRTQPDRQR